MADVAAAGPAAAGRRPALDAVVLRRILFGAVLIAISGGLLLIDWAKGTSLGLGALAVVAFVLGLRELFGMLSSLAPVLYPGLAYAAGLLVVATEVARHEAPLLAARRIPQAEVVIALYVCAVLGLELRKQPTREGLLSIVVTLFGVLYILLLGSFVLKARYIADILPPALLRGAEEIGFASVLYVIFAAKGTDVFAFFTGRFLGRRKLIPHISPGKTWAGAAGAFAGAVLITGLFSAFSDLGRVLDWTVAIPFGIIIGFTTQVGDLVESLIKRSAAVKDSGALVPEFGGVLDIIDCILFVAPVFYLGVLTLT